jgi:fibronectin type 3 domain-containing protein
MKRSALLLVAAAVMMLVGCPTAHYVLLTWSPEPQAATFRVYRNQQLIGTAVANSYTDSNPPAGADVYYVTAVGPTGLVSGPSNTTTGMVP